MNKNEFLAGLEAGLSGLPREDVEGRLSFYGEMIDDRVEEGASEEEAVADIGPVEEIVAGIVAETPITRIVREKIRPKRGLRPWEIVLLVLGFPVWFPLLLAAAVVVLSLYIVVWTLVVSLWAIEISLIACALAGIPAAVVVIARGDALPGIAALGVALFSAGLSILLFFVCVSASRGAARLAKKAACGIKSGIVGKESTK